MGFRDAVRAAYYRIVCDVAGCRDKALYRYGPYGYCKRHKAGAMRAKLANEVARDARRSVYDREVGSEIEKAMRTTDWLRKNRGRR